MLSYISQTRSLDTSHGFCGVQQAPSPRVYQPPPLASHFPRAQRVFVVEVETLGLGEDTDVTTAAPQKAAFSSTVPFFLPAPTPHKTRRSAFAPKSRQSSLRTAQVSNCCYSAMPHVRWGPAYREFRLFSSITSSMTYCRLAQFLKSVVPGREPKLTMSVNTTPPEDKVCYLVRYVPGTSQTVKTKVTDEQITGLMRTA